MFTWHTLLIRIALVAELAKENALFLQLAKATTRLSSMQDFASIVALAPAFVR